MYFRLLQHAMFWRDYCLLYFLRGGRKVSEPAGALLEEAPGAFLGKRLFNDSVRPKDGG